jgi:hypothetical protein
MEQTPEINQDHLWGRYQKHEDDKHRLHMKTVHKALNIPMEDDMNVKTTNNIRNGVNPWAVAAMLGVASVAPLGATYLLSKSKEAPKTETINKETIEKLQLKFYDDQGNEIHVPHISTKDTQ